MHYEIDGLEVRSENAAKSPARASRFVINWLASHQEGEVAVDYGCGKLRYASYLYSQYPICHFIDSEIQLTREQVISGKVTTVSNEIRSLYPNAVMHALESTSWRSISTDLIICTNVLSAIPYTESRIDAIKNMRLMMRPSAMLFICVQFRNSHFTRWGQSEKAVKYNDGFLLKRERTASFYACLTTEALQYYAKAADMEVIQTIKHEQNAAIVLRKPTNG